MNDKLAASQNSNFHIFPSENFIDLCLYQYGHEKCSSGHLFGPATRNHYLFHYVLSGTGTLMAANSKGENQTYKIHSGQGFMIFPEQITTYIADVQVPWEYGWSLTGCEPRKFSISVDFPRMRPFIRQVLLNYGKSWRRSCFIFPVILTSRLFI